MLKPNILVHFSFKLISLFSFQTSFWRWQWILPVPQRVFSQPENEETDQSGVGNDQETDGEASTVCFHLSTLNVCLFVWVSLMFHLKLEILRRLLWWRCALSTHPRCSPAFFTEERTALKHKRQKMRLLQQRKLSDLSNCKDLPDEIPLPLIIGTKVTGETSTRYQQTSLLTVNRTFNKLKRKTGVYTTKTISMLVTFLLLSDCIIAVVWLMSLRSHKGEICFISGDMKKIQFHF